MLIVCQLCQKPFEKIISSSHLKFAHNISSKEYKEQFGELSLASDEYRAHRSAAHRGENNPNFGNRMSTEVRQTMSTKLKGRVPHNKGKTVTDPDQLNRIRTAILMREQKYKETGYHPRLGAVLDQTTKEKISNSIKTYAEQHPQSLKQRAAKSVATKKSNGYYQLKRQQTINKIQKKWEDFGYTVVNTTETQIVLKHVDCGNQYQRGVRSEINPRLCKHCFPVLGTSRAEIELKEWITNSIGVDVVVGSRSILDDGFELDLVIPSLKIAIEYNGLYWHSESAGKSKWYHITKLNKCQEKGLRLVQIFEDEWINHQDIVKQRLLFLLNIVQSNKVFARKTKLISISSKQSKEFCNKHHIQGAGTGHICYGLSYNEKLVAIMEFGHLSKAKGQSNTQGHYELTRYCSDGQVVGGAGKLLKAFVKDHTPEMIISYCDLRWNTGNLYQQLGFAHQGNTVPNYWYTIGQNRYHRFKFRKDVLVKQGHDASKTEREIMADLGYHVIWDCGHGKWIWNKKAE